MKKFSYIVIMCACALLCACEKEPDLQKAFIPETWTNNLASTSVDVCFNVYMGYQTTGGANVKTYGVYYSTKSTEPGPSDMKVEKTNSDNTEGSLKVTLSYLTDNTKYYARAYVRDAMGVEIVGDVIEFTTQRKTDYSIKMNFIGVSDITTTSAKFKGTITIGQDVLSQISQCGYFFSDYNSNPVSGMGSCIYTEPKQAGTSELNWSVDKLQKNTTYHVRMFYKMGSTYYYDSDIKSFKTLADGQDEDIIMVCNDATDVTANSATVSGSFTIPAEKQGLLEEAGFVRGYTPDVDCTGSFSGRYISSYTNVSSWSGTTNVTKTYTDLNARTTFYYKMYYKVNSQYYYTEAKSFTTLGGSGGAAVTVNELLDIYNSLNLTQGQVADGFYTVRGYVTEWLNGYPTYQNGDFWISNSDGGTSQIRCYRLVGQNTSDQRQLNVGDYIEAKDCQLTNYNGPELKNGFFTIITPAPSWLTVAQFRDAIIQENLSSVQTSTGRYTVRGYVTKWIQGYPAYQYATFRLDDDSNNTNSDLEAYRVVCSNTSDQRQLNVGDYVELRNCSFWWDLDGTGYLQDGTYVIISSAQ